MWDKIYTKLHYIIKKKVDFNMEELINQKVKRF